MIRPPFLRPAPSDADASPRGGASAREGLRAWSELLRVSALPSVPGDGTLPVEVYDNGPRHVFVGLDDVPALSAL
ncbi:hypothetical protein ABZ054_21205, partial [Streptomyces sp. NPDC006324]